MSKVFNHTEHQAMPVVLEILSYILTNYRIDVNMVIKVADFGLSESVGTKEYFRQDKDSAIKLPIKWLAPESMEDYMFSEKSDVVFDTHERLFSFYLYLSWFSGPMV